MFGRVFCGLSSAALVSATAVLAEPSGSASNGANKQICRAVADTGSRLGRSRVCHTEQEWAELRRQTQQNVDHVQNARAASGQ